MTTDQIQGNAGDFEENFARLYEKYKAQISAYIYHLVDNSEQADDLTQDTFIKAYRALPQMGANLQFAAWLYRIATNTALDALRRRKRIVWIPWHAVENDAGDEVGEDPQGRFADGRTERVRLVIARLPHKYRVPLLLYHLRDLSYREIAQVLGMSEETVRTRLYRARRQFRAIYLDLLREEESAEREAAARLCAYPADAASQVRERLVSPEARTPSAAAAIA
jgi:RNA polymerase sigma-70 factor, ECF subfamily